MKFNPWLLAFDIGRLLAAVVLILGFFIGLPDALTVFLITIVMVGLVTRWGTEAGYPRQPHEW